LRLLATTTTTTTGATWTTWAAAWTHLLRKLGKLVLTELAVLVGVEFHRAIDERLRIGWPKTAGTAAEAAAASSAEAASKATAASTESTPSSTAAASAAGLPLGHLSQLFLRQNAVIVSVGASQQSLHPLGHFVLGKLAIFVGIELHVSGHDFFSAGSWSAATTRAAGTTGSVGRCSSATASARTSLSIGRTAWSATATGTTRTTASTKTFARRRSQLVFGQLSVVVSIESLEGGRRFFKLVTREFTVAVDVERADQRIDRSSASRSAGRGLLSDRPCCEYS